MFLEIHVMISSYLTIGVTFLVYRNMWKQIIKSFDTNIVLLSLLCFTIHMYVEKYNVNGKKYELYTLH